MTDEKMTRTGSLTLTNDTVTRRIYNQFRRPWNTTYIQKVRDEVTNHTHFVRPQNIFTWMYECTPKFPYELVSCLFVMWTCVVSMIPRCFTQSSHHRPLHSLSRGFSCCIVTSRCEQCSQWLDPYDRWHKIITLCTTLLKIPGRAIFPPAAQQPCRRK